MNEEAHIASLEQRIKDLEAELYTCKAQLNSFINNLPFISWIKDSEGRYMCVNEPFLNNSNKPLPEIIGKRDADIYSPQKALKEDEEDKKILETGKKFLFTDKLGDKWFETYKTPIKAENNEVIGLAGIQRDVSDIRRAITSLNTERDLLQALMDNFPYTIYFKDKESRFIRVNKAQATLLGISHPDEAIGKTDFDYFTRLHALEAYKDEQKILTTGEQLIGKTERIRNAQGKFIWVSATKIAIRNRDGEITGLVGISIDVTDRHLANQKLREARKKAVESDKLKSAFLANMSHEIRTPMNGIIGFSNLLKMGGIEKEQQLEYLGFIEKCGNTLLALIDDIIDISKIEAGQLTVRSTETCITDILHEVFLSFDKNRLPEEKEAVELRLMLPDTGYPQYIRTDPYRFKQVISNLIGNALKFTDEGFVEFGYRTTVGDLEFYVKDTGIGIPKDKFKVIFDRFGQVIGNDKHNQKGTGLGLAISVNIVKLLGGRMWVESELGKGSAFYFTLPLKHEELLEEKLKGTAHVISNFEWVGKKLLVVDDEELNWIFIRDLMKPTQANLIWAKNGKEAVDIYQDDTHIDLILMDFRMPVMNGFEATKVIRSFDPQIPIIALTAYAQEEEKELILHAGCNGFLSKPVRNEQLFSMINHFLVN